MFFVSQYEARVREIGDGEDRDPATLRYGEIKSSVHPEILTELVESTHPPRFIR